MSVLKLLEFRSKTEPEPARQVPSEFLYALYSSYRIQLVVSTIKICLSPVLSLPPSIGGSNGIGYKTLSLSSVYSNVTLTFSCEPSTRT